ncbi:FecR domain-containing protein [Mucilaginibacter sp.]|uniref:FecR family protein n=1 Tax=Mucilaginibacter sp. TaxID=1882438 RepID=UPI0025D72F16|nr:FecR domain-containing protein [Mucilaginibacter sp.]
MNNNRLKYLLQQYFDDTISRADCTELLNYLKENPAEIADLVDEELLKLDADPEFNQIQARKVLDNIKTDPRFNQAPLAVKPKTKIVSLFGSLAKVAAVIAVFSAVGFYLIHKHKPADNQVAIVKSSKILPGSNKAVLTLANGKAIVLDNKANGTLAKAGQVQVNKVANGKLVYDALPTDVKAKVIDNALVYNTLSTPRGGEYQVVLPDGTHVWLNSASSISYPVEFAGNERRVKLTGEAYFEVAKNKDKPFYVNSNNVQVRVLGTHFNISAYNDDDELKATLLEGSVQVSKNNSQSLLKPGQQAVINNGADMIRVSQANINEVMAWKNGYFIFNDDNIATILKKVSRWYDVDVEQKGNFEGQHFGGTFYRTKGIDELLKNLEKIGKVHFKVTGRRVTAME